MYDLPVPIFIDDPHKALILPWALRIWELDPHGEMRGGSWEGRGW